jgi:hypothetical protein
MNEKTEIKNLQSFKVVLMGESGVGKTSIVNRYTKDIFEDNILSTAGVCFFSKILDFPEIKKNCKLDVIKIIYLIIHYVYFHYYRYGIPQGKKDIKVLLKFITKKVMQLYSYMI